jgi:hypothetical protein
VSLCFIPYKDHEIEMRKTDPPHSNWHVYISGPTIPSGRIQIALEGTNKQKQLSFAKWWVRDRLEILTSRGLSDKA